MKHQSYSLLLFLMLLICPPATAAEFHITTGQTDTSGKLLDSGETGIIDAGGSLNPSGGSYYERRALSRDPAGTTTGAGFTLINNGLLTGAYEGINLDAGGNNTIENNGTIEGISNDAINGAGVGGHGNSISNTGIIQGHETGINLALGTGNRITNSHTGQILGQDSAIRLANDNIIDNSGTISSTTHNGISAGERLQIGNSGTIHGDDYALYAGNFLTLSNDGNIDGDQSGIQAFDNATMINNGSITATTNNAVLLGDNADITNRGRISGAQAVNAGSSASINNEGTLTGTDLATLYCDGDSTVTNSGLIEFLGGPGTALAVGQNSTIENTGTIRGTEEPNSVTGVSLAGNTSYSGSGTISNVGTGISSGMDSVIQNSGEISAYETGIYNFSGNIVNSGSIAAGTTGIDNFTGNILNTGSIAADAAAITSISGAVDNRGTLSSNGSGGAATVEFLWGQDDLLNNSGTITNSTAAAVKISAAVGTDTTTRVINSGTITGADSPTVDINASDSFAIINSGIISNDNGRAIRISGTADNEITLEYGGRINGAIETGDGDDLIQLARQTSISGHLDLGDGNNSINLAQDATITGQITSGGADDSLSLDEGAVINGNIDLGDGNNSISLVQSTLIDGNITGGADDDTLVMAENTIVSGNVNLGAGAATLNMARGATIMGSLVMGGAEDMLIMEPETTVGNGINLGGGNDNLQIAVTTNISGRLEFGDGQDSLTLTGTPGNRAIAIDSLEQVRVETPLFVKGDRVLLTFDPTAYTMTDDILSDLVLNLHSALQERHFNQGATKGRGISLWLSPFTSLSQVKADGQMQEFDHVQKGLLVGAEKQFGKEFRAGLFVGASSGTAETGDNNYNSDMNGGYTGLYAGLGRNNWQFESTAITGRVDHTDRRTGIDTLAAGGGYSIATSYKSTLTAAALKGSYTWHLKGFPIVPSLSLGWQSLSQDSRDETYQDEILTIGKRTTELVRIASRLTFPRIFSSGGLRVHGHLELARTLRTQGDKVELSLSETKISATAGDDDSITSGLAGIGLLWNSPAERWQVGCVFDYSMGSNQGERISAVATAALNF